MRSLGARRRPKPGGPQTGRWPRLFLESADCRLCPATTAGASCRRQLFVVRQLVGRLDGGRLIVIVVIVVVEQRLIVVLVVEQQLFGFLELELQFEQLQRR